MAADPSTPPAFGYHGRYLRVDLTRGTSEAVPLSGEMLRSFLGGSGLGVHLLQREAAAGAEPLSPEASLAFVFSPLVGSPLTTSAKFAVVSKSPLTERINDSLASSGFAIAGKKTGFDAILIAGRAAEPSILVIDDGEVRIEPAAGLWGLDIDAAAGWLRQRFPGDACSAIIGPAGERLVRYATISHDGRHAGRGGNGAVLGAKNVKAVVVRGSQRCAWAWPRELTALAKQLSARSFGPATAKYRELGTASNLLTFNRLHALPTRNFQQGSFAAADALSPESLSASRGKTRASCAACTIGCEHIYRLDPVSGEQPIRGVRVEYENLFALGSLCGIGDAGVVLAASQRCDQLGLDTISLGGTVAFAMECAERGFAPQVKGLELPGYEPRALQTMALGLAVGTRGADHNRSSAYEVDFSPSADRRRLTPQAVTLAIEAEDKATLMDSLILCKFLRGVFRDFFAEAAEMLHLVTGWDVTSAELRATAKRIIHAKKQFNVAAGWTPAEDTLPARFFAGPLEDDPAARLTRQQLQAAVHAYNLQRGWDADGWPQSESA